MYRTWASNESWYYGSEPTKNFHHLNLLSLMISPFGEIINTNKGSLQIDPALMLDLFYVVGYGFDSFNVSLSKQSPSVPIPVRCIFKDATPEPP